MEQLFKIIYEVIEKKEEYDNFKNIEKEIMQALLVKISEYCNIKYISFLLLSKEDIDDIKNSEIYQRLKDIENNINLQDENIIPIVYEFLNRGNYKQESLSVYYTPLWLIEYIISNTLPNLSYSDTIKILEPSCGCGMFITYLFDYLYKKFKIETEEDDLNIIKKITKIIYGYDIDKEAIGYLKIVISFKIVKILKYLPKIKLNIYNLNYLLDNNINNEKFDFVVGNPPYLENRKINKYYNKDILKKAFRSAKGRFDIYSLFIEKSLMLLKEGGILSFVVPSSLLGNNNFTEIRKIILEKTKIVQITNLGSSIFDNVDNSMITIILKKEIKCNDRHIIKCKNISSKRNKEIEIKCNDYRYIPQRFYEYNLNNVFDIDSDERVFNLREKLYRKYNRLNDICEIVSGVATGNIRKKLLTNKKCRFAHKVLEGKNIEDYYNEWSGLYIIDDKSIIDRKNGEYATFMRKEFITNEKILIRQTADRFICTIDENGYYLLNTLYSLIIRKEYHKDVDIKYILALLNSKLYSFLYRSLIREKGKLFPQLKIFHVQYSPFLQISLNKQKEFINIVNNIINIKKNIKVNENISKVDKLTLSNKITELKNQIDNLVYEIFELCNREINTINEELSS